MYEVCVKYFVLLSKNLSEYGAAMNTSYLQNPATGLCHKVYSRICLLPLIFSNFPSLYLMAITVSHFYPRLGEATRRIILRIQAVKGQITCVELHYLLHTLILNFQNLWIRDGIHSKHALKQVTVLLLKATIKKQRIILTHIVQINGKRQLQREEDLVSDTHIWN